MARWLPDQRAWQRLRPAPLRSAYRDHAGQDALLPFRVSENGTTTHRAPPVCFCSVQKLRVCRFAPWRNHSFFHSASRRGLTGRRTPDRHIPNFPEDIGRQPPQLIALPMLIGTTGVTPQPMLLAAILASTRCAERGCSCQRVLSLLCGRGEAAAPRWRNVDLDGGALACFLMATPSWLRRPTADR